jgi:hypothetical protein
VPSATGNSSYPDGFAVVAAKRRYARAPYVGSANPDNAIVWIPAALVASNCVAQAEHRIRLAAINADERRKFSIDNILFPPIPQ